ncbi:MULTISPECIES: R3H domain-containing nucleic acid-binding protein [unclassified Leptotrichia]|uniref:Jag family protein n=1 Tax=unclassified Leptotrichia TaxID=2633022 RepID=UPI0003FE470A|nr:MULTISPECIES: R3H domain-containing nucleic acid-binding protein [unclassified Leptotrichia]WLD74373.1 R3H domain-containing nucleic acid-binding protein [Leptotrichia sp. HMT-225]
MEKIVLKAQNEEELKNMVSRSLTLKEDETYQVKVLKHPKKILFINIKGEYEVKIVKKSELKTNENKTKVEKTKTQSENNNVKKETKKENGNNYPKNNNKKNYKNENSESKEKSVTNQPDTNIDKIRAFFKEFIVNIKMDIRIVNIKKENNNKYLVILDGKDMRFLIGEKGNTLNSFEYLLSTTRQFKNIKIVVDSNNYKEKREKSLRDLARKKGKAVLSTGNAIKLNPMSARERKIIHEEVSFMKGLQTESVGEEPKRYLVIKKLDEKF